VGSLIHAAAICAQLLSRLTEVIHRRCKCDANCVQNMHKLLDTGAGSVYNWEAVQGWARTQVASYQLAEEP